MIGYPQSSAVVVFCALCASCYCGSASSVSDVAISSNESIVAIEGAPAKFVEYRNSEKGREIPLDFAATSLACSSANCWIGGRVGVRGRIVRVSLEKWTVDEAHDTEAAITMLSSDKSNGDVMAVTAAGEVIEWTANGEKGNRWSVIEGETSAMVIGPGDQVLLAVAESDGFNLRTLTRSGTGGFSCATPSSAGAIYAVGELTSGGRYFAGGSGGELLVITEKCAVTRIGTTPDASAITACDSENATVICGTSKGGVYVFEPGSQMPRRIADTKSIVRQVVVQKNSKDVIVGTMSAHLVKVQR